MLELKSCCEHCARPLPNGSTEAMICSFECTFCSTCVEEILKNVCPNCGGAFEKRPTRPQALLGKYPPAQDSIHRPIDKEAHEQYLILYQHIAPHKR
jgi:uncharacterized protein